MRYTVEIYSGGTYCGNGLFDTLDECEAFFKADEFCDKAKIIDLETGEKKVIKA